ncbi:glycosyltransferase [Microbacterium album]|uniref:Uncharacterized protein n=1 Tax=Microbacterium album TaxID=2053191 RepID=A0A917MNC5_9MICO|nr:glycosyltransferase [Microbacterium album]GGH49035.1 hypothetical protein GCM10010921_26940 [Microbacterium album]
MTAAVAATPAPAGTPAPAAARRHVAVLGAQGREQRDLHANRLAFSRLLDIAESRVRSGRTATALEWCRIAASFAMTNATGQLRSDRLERIVDLAAAALPPSRPAASLAPTGGGARRVLHVLSEAADIGGLTRLAERWIRRAGDSVSSVVLTRQDAVPDPLARAAGSSGGTAVALGALGALTRAARLRRLAEHADVVVCHLQPDDPVAAAAFGSGYAGAPVAVYNHADHLFWLAPTRATAIVDFRRAGAELTTRARGYAASTTELLPLLVPREPTDARRDAVRASLEVGPDDVLVITAARAVKYRDTQLRPRFAELAAAVLDADPRVVLCAVGPEGETDPWPELYARYPGRVRATGPVAGTARHLCAADLYLDPYPFSSLTSLLEAAAWGLPTLTLDGHRGLRRALGVAEFVTSAADRPRDLAALTDRVRALARDPHARAEAGRSARAAHAALVPEEKWATAVQGLYRRLEEAARGGQTVGAEARAATVPEPGDELADYGLALLAVEQRIPLLWTVSGGMGGFDRRDRAEWRARTLAVRLARRCVPGWCDRWQARLLGTAGSA